MVPRSSGSKSKMLARPDARRCGAGSHTRARPRPGALRSREKVGVALNQRV